MEGTLGKVKSQMIELKVYVLHVNTYTIILDIFCTVLDSFTQPRTVPHRFLPPPARTL